jgi:hypothetical protein
VTPDGRNIVFESSRPLTGYDNLNGNPEEEVFVFSVGSGLMSCASCNPSGTPPAVRVYQESVSLLAASRKDTHMSRWISDDGSRVFFDSRQPLVPQDTNGVQDVYEWERNGAGTCHLEAGCIYLLSGGESSDFSYFVEADPTGENIFFTHRGAVAGFGPRGEENELYDARVHGGFPKAEVGCAGTGCQGVPPAPPSFATPSSYTFSGAGNFLPASGRIETAGGLRARKIAQALKLCRKKRNKHKRVLCERQARKRYGPIHTAKKAGERRNAK